MKGEILWTSRGDLQKSGGLFEEAISEDPYNAQAYAGLASATALIGQVPNDGMQPQDANPKARDAAQHALKLDPRLAEAHAVLGNVAMSYDWNFAESENEFKTALKLNPNYPFAHEWYAQLLMVQGRYDEALAETRHVLELEPATPLFHVVKAEILYHARRYDEAIDEASGVVKAHPEVSWPTTGWAVPIGKRKCTLRPSLPSSGQGEWPPDLAFTIMAWATPRLWQETPSKPERP